MLFETTAEGALRSFFASALCMPAFLALRLLAWSNGGAPQAGVVQGVAAELVGFVLAVAGYALASLPVAEALGRRGRWPLYIAAWNYANLVQYAVLLAATAVPQLLGVPSLIAQTLGLATLGYMLWLEWFIARVALGVTAAQAAGFVLLNLIISVFVAGLVARVS